MNTRWFPNRAGTRCKRFAVLANKKTNETGRVIRGIDANNALGALSTNPVRSQDTLAFRPPQLRVDRKNVGASPAAAVIDSASARVRTANDKSGRYGSRGRVGARHRGGVDHHQKVRGITGT